MREAPISTNEMAGITIRVAFQVILMFRFRFPEYASRLDLDHYPTWPKSCRIHVSDRLFCSPILLVVMLQRVVVW